MFELFYNMNIPRTPKEIKEYHTKLQVLVNMSKLVHMDSGGGAGSWYSDQAEHAEWVQQHGFQWDVLVYISVTQWQPGNKVAPRVTISSRFFNWLLIPLASDRFFCTSYR